MQHVFNDGGREKAGFKGQTGDCVTRAISIVTGQDYASVYHKIHELNKEYAQKSRSKLAKEIEKGGGKRGTTPRNGVSKKIYHDYLLGLGMKWKSTMQIGQGCKVHLKKEELPSGKIIVRVSKHLAAVVDGVIYDTHDCSRRGTRCVYGYYHF